MKILFKISKRLRKLRIKWYRFVLSEQRDCLKTAVICQPVLACGSGNISVGRAVTFGWQYSPLFHSGYTYLEARFPTANIEIGEGTFFNNSCSIIANTTSIKIGEHCRIGYGCSFIDSDFHGAHPDERDLPGNILPDSQVVIGNNVFIGSNVAILKGVTIGDGSVIGAGSIVTRSIPPMSIAAGNPCRVIRQITESDKLSNKGD